MKRIVPSVDVWRVPDLLEARMRQYEAMDKSDPNTTYVEPDDEVLCDFCSDKILEETVAIVDFGSRAACDKCYWKHFANKPLEHRELNEDGTLGRKL